MKIVSATVILALIASMGNSSPVKSFEVLNNSVKQGETTVVKIYPQWQGQMVCVSAFGRQYRPDKYGYVYLSVSLYETLGKKVIRLVECGRGVFLDSYSEKVEIVKNLFPKTRKISSGIAKSSRPRKNWELKAIKNAFVQKTVDDMTNSISYAFPLDNLDVIDPFGFIYQGNNHLAHYGVDLRTPTGTPVKSSNRGKVALVANDYSKEGNMVILSHGLGIFSVYMHLSEIHVKDGDIIERGQVIGLSGETGAGVREPHLHFNIKIQGIYIEPLSFVRLTGEQK